jgi:hypothetical protein
MNWPWNSIAYRAGIQTASGLSGAPGIVQTLRSKRRSLEWNTVEGEDACRSLLLRTLKESR